MFMPPEGELSGFLRRELDRRRLERGQRSRNSEVGKHHFLAARRRLVAIEVEPHRAPLLHDDEIGFVAALHRHPHLLHAFAPLGGHNPFALAEEIPDDERDQHDAADEQILLNLLTNAAKFTSSGGSVTVSCQTTGEHTLINVADTGRGIPSDQLERIFEPFVQVRGSADGDPATRKGFGLGLAISRELARRMNGDLTVISTPGVGSTFTLILRSPPQDGGSTASLPELDR